MTPNEYISEIAIPTVRDFLNARGDRRLAYLACIATYHIVDYVAAGDSTKIGEILRHLRTIAEPAVDVVQGICHGTKHARATKARFPFSPGDERHVPSFAFDVPGAGWGEGRWGGPGFEVDHLGRFMFIDECVQTLLLCLKSIYPAAFADVSLDFMEMHSISTNFVNS